MLGFFLPIRTVQRAYSRIECTDSVPSRSGSQRYGPACASRPWPNEIHKVSTIGKNFFVEPADLAYCSS